VINNLNSNVNIEENFPGLKSDLYFTTDEASPKFNDDLIKDQQKGCGNQNLPNGVRYEG